MNEDKPVARGDITERYPTFVEKVGPHPLGTAAGVIGGAAAGALIGIAAGPVGSLVGAVGGGLLGGALGASVSVGPQIDMTKHDRYWLEHFATRPYVPAGADYADFGPAYRHGTREYLSAATPRDWSEVESDLAQGWEAAKGSSRLTWDDAKPAVRDAWDRLRNAPE